MISLRTPPPCDMINTSDDSGGPDRTQYRLTTPHRTDYRAGPTGLPWACRSMARLACVVIPLRVRLAGTERWLDRLGACSRAAPRTNPLGGVTDLTSEVELVGKSGIDRMPKAVPRPVGEVQGSLRRPGEDDALLGAESQRAFPWIIGTRMGFVSSSGGACYRTTQEAAIVLDSMVAG